MTARDRGRLGHAIGALPIDGTIIPAVDGADVGIERLTIAMHA